MGASPPTLYPTSRGQASPLQHALSIPATWPADVPPLRPFKQRPSSDPARLLGEAPLPCDTEGLGSRRGQHRGLPDAWCELGSKWGAWEEGPPPPWLPRWFPSQAPPAAPQNCGVGLLLEGCSGLQCPGLAPPRCTLLRVLSACQRTLSQSVHQEPHTGTHPDSPCLKKKKELLYEPRLENSWTR